MLLQAGRDLSHTSNVMGKECCWEARIRDTQADMLKWGRNVAGRFRSESHQQQCYGELMLLAGSG